MKAQTKLSKIGTALGLFDLILLEPKEDLVYLLINLDLTYLLFKSSISRPLVKIRSIGHKPHLINLEGKNPEGETDSDKYYFTNITWHHFYTSAFPVSCFNSRNK
jgi:hypothetical protein